MDRGRWNDLGGLYPVLDSRAIPLQDFGEAARSVIDGGCRVLQLRCKDETDREVLAVQRQVTRALGERHACVVINDRADMARVLASECPANIYPGLHLGQDDLDPVSARAIVGDQVHLAWSTHNPEQVEASRSQPIDAIAYGPVFSTESKEAPDPCVGLEGLANAVRSATHPVIAIGGLMPSTVPPCFEAGAVAAAVIGGLFVPWSAALLPERLDAFLGELR